jgi:hypothetical protein
MVLEEDVLLDRKGARCVSYLSSGRDCGVHAAAVSSGQIAEDGSATENLVEIVDSGTIEVTEVANDGGEDGDDDEEAENNFNTDNEPYRKRLSDGDSIIVNS